MKRVAARAIEERTGLSKRAAKSVKGAKAKPGRQRSIKKPPEDQVLSNELTELFKRLDAASERQHRTLDELLPKLRASHLLQA